MIAATIPLSAAPSPPQQIFIQQARAAKLGEQDSWRRLLYYSPRLWRRATSLVSDPRFFYAPQGASDSEAELLATIEALFQAPIPGKEDDHARCRFPARSAWLESHLGLKPELLPPVNCARYDGWRKDLHYEAVSLIFSSYYPNNPSSMYGHTFIRLHRKAKGGTGADLLDDAINFSAFPDTDNPILYTVNGLMGRFPGRFSLTSYALKIQEYNNAESRDLWQYRLDFNTSEIDFLLKALWEMGPHHINYYYFDTNCSAVILSFLEAVKPNVSLVTRENWVIPADTVRKVTSIPGFVTDVSFRASNLKRFLAHYRHLDAGQKSVFADLVASPFTESSRASYTGLSTRTDKVLVLDTVLEYIDYDEKLAGTKSAEKHAALRRWALAERSGFTERPFAVTDRPDQERPDIGHPSQRFGLGFGVDDTKRGFADLMWRPALHDHLGDGTGYAPGLSISFFDTRVRLRAQERRAILDRFALFHISSLPTVDSIIRRPAWQLSLESEARYGCRPGQAASLCQRAGLKGGGGLNLTFGAYEALSAYGLLNAALGWTDEVAASSYVSPSLAMGIYWRPVSAFTAHMAYEPEFFMARHVKTKRRDDWRVEARLSLRQDWDMVLQGKGQDKHRELSLGLFHYQ